MQRFFPAIWFPALQRTHLVFRPIDFTTYLRKNQVFFRNKFKNLSEKSSVFHADCFNRRTLPKFMDRIEHCGKNNRKYTGDSQQHRAPGKTEFRVIAQVADPIDSLTHTDTQRQSPQ